MVWIITAGAWLKKRWKLVIGAFVAVIATVVGIVIAAGSFRRKAATLRDVAIVERTKTKIARLRGQRSEILRQVGETDARIETIDRELEQNRQEIIKARLRANVPNLDLAAELKRLGY